MKEETPASVEIEKAEAFLNSAVKNHKWGTPNGLNRLPYVLYEAVAKVMQEYSQAKDKEIKTLTEEVDEYSRNLKNAADIGSKLTNEIYQQAKEISALQSQLSAKEAEIESVKRLLHDLTPGGSEFYNDPKYCAEWIMKNREENHYTLSNIIKDLKTELKYYRELAEAANEVIKVMDVPKNKSSNTLIGGNNQFDLFRERNHKWQALKNQKPE